MKCVRSAAAAVVCMALPALAQAAELDGARLSVLWAVPFAGLLLSIALMPLLLPNFWHHHFGKVTAAWSLAFLIPLVITHGAGATAVNFVHALLAEYLPFVILLTALYVVAGGIYIRGSLTGTPLLNTGIHGHHGCLHAPDSPADSRQCTPQQGGAHCGVLHLHRLQRRWLAHAAG